MELWIIAVFILAALYVFRNSAPMNYLKDWFRVWKERRAEQKKIQETYRHIDMNAEGKFNRKAHIRMINQMKKSRK